MAGHQSQLEHSERERAGNLKVFVEFDELLGADVEWILRLVDYSVQNVVLESLQPSPTERQRVPFGGRIGRFAPETSDISLRLKSAKTERSLELVFTLWTELPRIAALVVTADVLRRAFVWLKEHRGSLHGSGLPRLPKLTIEGISTGRIRTLRITLQLPRRQPEKFDYIRNSGYR